MHMNMHMNMCIYGSNAQAAHGVKRVAVLDFDVHHGNGCAAACWADPTRLYASSHQLGLFPAGPHGKVGHDAYAVFPLRLPVQLCHGAILTLTLF